MKRCDLFKDLILTDYIDGQLDKESTQSLEAHLLACSDCQSFLKEVKLKTVSPFQHVPRQPVPGELWQKIAGKLQEQPQASDAWSDFLNGLSKWVVFPRLVPVLASLGVMLWVGSISFDELQLRRVQNSEQGQYLVSVISTANPVNVPDSNDLGTPVEQYFL